jgi:hypothetical protein
MTTATNQTHKKTLKLVTQVSVHSQDFPRTPEIVEAANTSLLTKQLLPNSFSNSTTQNEIQNPEPFHEIHGTAGQPKPGGRKLGPIAPAGCD